MVRRHSVAPLLTTLPDGWWLECPVARAAADPRGGVDEA